MLCIELRRPIIPPSCFTIAQDKSPCSRANSRCLSASAAVTLHPRRALPSCCLSFAAACCLHSGSSVNRLFSGFDGVRCFDLPGFVRACALCRWQRTMALQRRRRMHTLWRLTQAVNIVRERRVPSCFLTAPSPEHQKPRSHTFPATRCTSNMDVCGK